MKAWICRVLGAAVAVSYQAQAQVRPPTTANPLENLPRVEAPTKPRVNTSVQARAPNAQLEALLAHTLTPQRFDVVGVHAVPFAEIAALFTPMRGKTVRIADVLAAATHIADIYKAHGYALSFGFVPGQNFANGDVRIVVVEGYVARVDVDGDPGNLDGKIRAIAQHIVEDRPLHQKTFERYLQVLGMLPGVHINANVPAPTTTDGATTLVLSVKRTRLNASAGLDFNHPGTQGLISVVENGETPLGEQLTFSTLFPDGGGDQKLYSLGYVQPIGSQGLSTHLTASHYEGSPNTDDELPAYLEQNEKQDRLELGASYPLLLDSRTNLSLGGSVYGTNLREEYFNTSTGASILQRYDVRALDGKLDFTKASDTSASKLSVDVAHGMNALGASASVVTRVGDTIVITPADVSFTRYDASFVQTNLWPHRFGTVFSVAGQYSSDTLPSTEQISFGGPRFGLAYDPGETAGDSGWGASFEVNRPFDLTERWLKQLTPYFVTQFARVYLNTGTAPISNLGSVALGLRWSDKHYYSFDLSLAQPVGDKPIGATHRDPRVNFSFSYQFR